MSRLVIHAWFPYLAAESCAGPEMLLPEMLPEMCPLVCRLS